MMCGIWMGGKRDGDCRKKEKKALNGIGNVVHNFCCVHRQKLPQSRWAISPFTRSWSALTYVDHPCRNSHYFEISQKRQRRCVMLYYLYGLALYISVVIYEIRIKTKNMWFSL